MKPLMSRTEDTSTLQDLGRASIQIVHDLKNQLNGLKLYATFLRKRIEKGGRPEDEQETIGKLINGLDRAASDLSTIVEYGREIDLKKQSGFDLQKILRTVCAELTSSGAAVSCAIETDPMPGEFDPSKLADAFRWISIGALKYRQNSDHPEGLKISAELKGQEAKEAAEITWSGLAALEHDPFVSFAGSEEIRLSLAAKIIESHAGSARYDNGSFVVTLPLIS
jgi:light-regulated signal transduction histidine kinase (bacteriophytochrome)